MSIIRDKDQAMQAIARRVNAGRKPKFGDHMRNPWAGEGNPLRDGTFIAPVSGKRPEYQMTDCKGRLWRTSALTAMFIDHLKGDEDFWAEIDQMLSEVPA